MSNKEESKLFIFKFHMNNGEIVDIHDYLPAETVKEALFYFKLKFLFTSKLKYSNAEKIVVIEKNKINFFTIQEV